MNQQIDLLKSILFAEWTTLVTFGICLLVLQKQKKPAYQLYTRARQLLAINFLIFAMEPFLYWLKEEEIYSIPYPETISLSLYLIVTVLLSMIYLPFVQPDYITRKRVLHNVIFLAGCLSFLCIGAIIGGTFKTDQPYNCNGGSLNNGYSFGNPFLQLLPKGATKDG